VGKLWANISAQEIWDATLELQRAGKLRTLLQPNLEIKNKGRPLEGKNASKESNDRAKSFLEEMKDFGNPGAAVRQVLAGGAPKNAGGKRESRSLAHSASLQGGLKKQLVIAATSVHSR
jgi:hypothetical protein